MKNLIKYMLIGILLFSSKSVAAQKELVLDSVFTISEKLTCKTFLYYTDTVRLSVPSGKTWKIEHLGFYITSSSVNVGVSINGNRFYNFRANTAGGQYEGSYESAFWLGPNDKIELIVLGSAAGQWGNVLLSVLEFKLE